MKRAFRIAIAAGALAAVVAGLAATPPGWRLAAAGLAGAARGAGLELSVGSLSGNLLRRVAIDGLELREPGGPVIARVRSIEVEYRLGGLARRKIVVPKLRVQGAELLFERGADGRLVGWSRFERRGGRPGRAPGRREWTADVALEIDDLSAAFRDAAAGLAVDAAGVSVRGRGGPQGYEATGRGALSLSSASLAAPVTGTFECVLSGAGDHAGISSLSISTSVGTVEAEGAIDGDSLRVAFGTALDVAGLAEVIGVSDLSGAVTAEGTVVGRSDSLVYAATVSGRDIEYAATVVPWVRATVSGGPRRIEVEPLVAGFAGGTVEASVRADLAAPGRANHALGFEVAARGIEIARLAEALPDTAPRISGRLTVTANGRADSLGIGRVRAGFSAAVPALSIAGSDAGPFDLSGGLEDGRLTFEASLLAARIGGTGALADSGLTALHIVAELRDLSVPAAAFGAPGIAGQGRAAATLAEFAAGPVVDAELSVPDLRVGEVQVGPVTARASGRMPSLRVAADAFGGALEAEGTVGEGGVYAMSVAAESLALAWPGRDSLTPPVSVALTADGDVRGGPGAAFEAAGVIGRVETMVGPERLTLAHPAEFAASRESLHVSSVVLRGGIGELAIGGTISAGGANNLIARMTRLDLERAAALVPRAAVPVAGMLDGTVTVLGSGRGRRVTAEVGIDSLAVGGVVLEAVAIAAENDSTDLSFEVEAVSRDGGTMQAYGAIPVRPDSVRILALDPDREFGATVTWSGFAVSGGGLLPGVPGEKRFQATGAVLLAGTVGSLETLYGRGTLEGLTADFERVSFALSEPLDVDVAGGNVEVPRAALAVTRKRALGDPGGGSVVVSARFGHDAALALDVSLSRLDVGQLIEAFAPNAGPALSGRLDGRAEIRGTASAPEGSFAWTMEAPAVYGVGFTEFSGEGSVVPGAVRLDRAELRAPGGSVTASGMVPIGGEGRGEELDFRVSAPSFDLSGLSSLPPGVGPIRGTLSADVRVAGSATSPAVSGAVALKDGSVRVAGLADPIRDIGVDVVLEGRTAALREARARLGRGSVSASGYANLPGAGDRSFLFRARLDSPEVEVVDALKGRFAGRLTWAGSPSSSRLSGDVRIEKLDVTYAFGLGDLITASPVLTIRPRASDPRARIALDLDLGIDDAINISSNLADLKLEGGFHFGGTLLAPVVSGGVYADRGAFRYLDNTFAVRALSVAFTDRRRRDPYVTLEGEAEVKARSDEAYAVTLRLDGFAFDAVPELSSAPPLSQPDIASLLTFGDTVGSLVSGGGQAGSSAASFGGLAKQAFFGGLVGVAAGTMEELLRLDTVSVEGETMEEGGLTGAGITLGKRFGERLLVEYRTTLGRFDEREVEVALKLLETLSIESRADPEGNHAVGLRLRIPFR